MNKSTAIKKAGSPRKLAVLLGISTQAVHKWGDKVPELRVIQIKSLRPGWFKSGAR